MTDAELSTIFDAWAFRTSSLAHELSLRALTLSDRFTTYGLFDALLVATRTFVGGAAVTRVEARRLRESPPPQRPNADPVIHERILNWLAETHAIHAALESEDLPAARVAIDALSSATQLLELRLRGYVLRVSDSEG